MQRRVGTEFRVALGPIGRFRPRNRRRAPRHLQRRRDCVAIPFLEHRTNLTVCSYRILLGFDTVLDSAVATVAAASTVATGAATTWTIEEPIAQSIGRIGSEGRQGGRDHLSNASLIQFLHSPECRLSLQLNHHFGATTNRHALAHRNPPQSGFLVCNQR